jgi:hypothetical protein
MQTRRQALGGSLHFDRLPGTDPRGTFARGDLLTYRRKRKPTVFHFASKTKDLRRAFIRYFNACNSP